MTNTNHALPEGIAFRYNSAIQWDGCGLVTQHGPWRENKLKHVDEDAGDDEFDVASWQEWKTGIEVKRLPGTGVFSVFVDVDIKHPLFKKRMSFLTDVCGLIPRPHTSNQKKYLQPHGRLSQASALSSGDWRFRFEVACGSERSFAPHHDYQGAELRDDDRDYDVSLDEPYVTIEEAIELASDLALQFERIRERIVSGDISLEETATA